MELYRRDHRRGDALDRLSGVAASFRDTGSFICADRWSLIYDPGVVDLFASFSVFLVVRPAVGGDWRSIRRHRAGV